MLNMRAANGVFTSVQGLITVTLRVPAGYTLDGNVQLKTPLSTSLFPAVTTSMTSDGATLVATFDAIGERVRARAESNYAVGVCTPVSFGHPGLTIAIDTGTSRSSFDVAHGTFGLSGDTESCAAQHIAEATLACDEIDFCHPVCEHQQCGSDDGIDCGDCDAAHYCDPERLQCALSYAGPEPECNALALLAEGGELCSSSADCPEVAGGACVIECQSDAQCPPAPEGYAWLSPTCHGDGSGLCLLACDAGEVCPAGASCVTTGLGAHCLW
jgi:hypothetical protein